MTAGMATLDQRTEALALANRTRILNARQFQQIRAMDRLDGHAFVAEVLRHPEDREWSMRVGMLLMSIERVGVKKATDYLRAADIRGRDTHLSALTERQRNLLAGKLECAA